MSWEQVVEHVAGSEDDEAILAAALCVSRVQDALEAYGYRIVPELKATSE